MTTRYVSGRGATAALLATSLLFAVTLSVSAYTSLVRVNIRPGQVFGHKASSAHTFTV